MNPQSLKRVRKAVIPAAGMGTRFLPATRAVPKEMLPIIDTPMIQYIVEEAVQAGIEDIIFISAHHKDAIENHFDSHEELDRLLESKGQTELLARSRHASGMCNIISVRQKRPLGLGHAVLMAASVVGDEPFAVLLGDELMVSKPPCIGQLIDVYQKEGKSVVGVMEVAQSEVHKYGIVGGPQVRDKLWKVDRVIEKPSADVAPSRMAIPGRYVLSPEIFLHLKDVKPGRGGEIQLTDGLEALAKTSGLLAYQFEAERFDTGDRMGYFEATLAFALKRPELREGASALIKKYAQMIDTSNGGLK